MAEPETWAVATIIVGPLPADAGPLDSNALGAMFDSVAEVAMTSRPLGCDVSMSAEVTTDPEGTAEADRLRSELADARASYDGAMADLAALVEVAAAAISDETADDPGVMALMRYLAANHPAQRPGSERWESGDRVRHKLTKHAGVIVDSDLGRIGVRWDHDSDWRHWYEPADLEHYTEAPAPSATTEPDKVVDLMEALERSISEAKAARKRDPQPRGER
jgi:hypothetical protein